MHPLTRIIAGIALSAGVGASAIGVAAADSRMYGDPNVPRVGLGRSVTADVNTHYYYSQPAYGHYNYTYSYPQSSYSYSYTYPSHSYRDGAPSAYFSYDPPMTSYSYTTGYDYYPNRGWGQHYGVHGGYYDNPYNPYWGYQGPLGQGSGHGMKIAR